MLDSKWGLDQGFDTYFDDFDTADRPGGSSASIQRPGNEVVDKALPWIDSVRDDSFFAWIHLYDPHTPYDPPAWARVVVYEATRNSVLDALESARGFTRADYHARHPGGALGERSK